MLCHFVICFSWSGILKQNNACYTSEERVPCTVTSWFTDDDQHKIRFFLFAEFFFSMFWSLTLNTLINQSNFIQDRLIKLNLMIRSESQIVWDAADLLNEALPVKTSLFSYNEITIKYIACPFGLYALTEWNGINNCKLKVSTDGCFYFRIISHRGTENDIRILNWFLRHIISGRILNGVNAYAIRDMNFESFNYVFKCPLRQNNSIYNVISNKADKRPIV